MNEKLLSQINKNLEELNLKLKYVNKQVFNAKEAAEYLCIGYDTLLRLTRIGQIEYVSNGKNYIYKKEYLDRWLDKNKKVGIV